ncbi:MAG: PspC domain-containing protein [Bacteroidaceae bacterium]|nr:PspC domain-containing protein [Bacteroidaceae bacterium]
MGKLVRSRNRVLAGVCAGIAEYFKWNVSTLRLIWIVLSVIGVGSPVLFYLILWIVMPEARLGGDYAERMQKRLGERR